MIDALIAIVLVPAGLVAFGVGWALGGMLITKGFDLVHWVFYGE